MFTSTQPPVSCPNGFALARGVNISHWLSQREPDAPKPAGYFSAIDAGFLRASGFDHIRLPVDEPVLWDESGRRRADEWQRLHAALGWCAHFGLRVIVDLHIVRAHHFNAASQGGTNKLWTSRQAQDHLLDLWRELGAELARYPVDQVAYEILNEPVSPDPEVWNDILNRAHAVIREAERDRTVVTGSNMWQKTRTVPQLRLPAGDPNIVVSFHYYEPGMVSHYRSSWTALREYDGPVRYPGVPFPEEALPAEPSPALRKLLDEANRHYDREVIRAEIAVAVDFARPLGLPVYCGEWGCHRLTPRAVRLAWYRDVVSALEELGAGWSIWDYKGGFRIVDADTLAPDGELIDLLTRPG
jgi:endoglucanase